MTLLPEHLSDKAKPWPGYFLVRTTGEVVPLIAVDELPSGFDLKGVPRSLDLEDTIGMLNLGLQRSSGASYQLANVDDKEHLAEFAIRNKSPEQPSTKITISSPPKAPAARIPAASTAIVKRASTPTRPSLSSETQLCRHWCTHGICKWGQNCHYRHIMPMTFSGLQEIGLTDWPSWYRTLNPGYFSADITHRSGPARKNRAKPCAGTGCCGASGHAGHAVDRSTRNKGSPKVRGVPEYGRLSREEMGVGEQILERLRNMSKEEKKAAVKNVVEELGGNALLERATIKETRKWEDDSDESEVDEKAEIGEKNIKGTKDKLIDV